MSEKFKVNEIVTKTKERDNPVLVDFQNGKLQTDEANVCFFKARDTENPDKEIAVVATQSSIYRGFINESYKNTLVNNFLAIKNKKTGKVRLVQVDHASLMHNSYYKQKPSVSDIYTEKTAFAALTRSFGGKKGALVLDRKERMQVNIEVVKGQLEKTLEESVVEENDGFDISLNEANFNKFRPPFNADAKRVQEVFQLTDIIPSELLDRMDAEAKAVLEADVNQLPIKSELLKDKLRSLKESDFGNTNTNLTLAKVVIYMDALQTLIRSQEKNLKTMTLSNITEKVEIDIRQRFAEPNMLILRKTRHTREKSICYYIVLASILSPSYEVDLNLLANDLGISRQTIVKYAQIVYCKPIPKTDFLCMKLPSQVKMSTKFIKKHKLK